MKKTLVQNSEISVDGEHLKIRRTPKSRWSVGASFAVCAYFMYGLTVFGVRTHHEWTAIISGILLFLNVLMLLFMLAPHGEPATIDRATDQVLSGKKSVCLVSSIICVVVIEKSALFEVGLKLTEGKTIRLAPVATTFKNRAEAVRLADEIAQFLDVPIEQKTVAKPSMSKVSK